MKYIDEYRDPNVARKLIETIRRTASRRWTIMEVCGGQTHSILRHGIDEQLRDSVKLIHGPGCPVCVTPLESIDFAQQLAKRSGAVLVTFGDMLRVPGSRHSLNEIKADGGDVRAAFSPLDAVAMAQDEPERQFIFFAVGFETTAPTTALAVRQAHALGLTNFSILPAHVRVLPAMKAIMESAGNRVNGFLAAGHVCTITGLDEYQAFAQEYLAPIAATGFEPVDLLDGVLAVVRQLESGTATVENRYARSVQDEGNARAIDLIHEVYEICDRPWRGFGVIRSGGLRLRDQYAAFDAERRFGLETLPIVEPKACRSADVLAGKIRPSECSAYGQDCRPDHPLGAPMVSSEGACAAYFRYVGLPESP